MSQQGLPPSDEGNFPEPDLGSAQRAEDRFLGDHSNSESGDGFYCGICGGLFPHTEGNMDITRLVCNKCYIPDDMDVEATLEVIWNASYASGTHGVEEDSL